MPKNASTRGIAAYNYPLVTGQYRNTRVEVDPMQTLVYLHNNRILNYSTIDKVVSVNNCGWVGPTTVNAINNGLRQLGVAGSVAIRNKQMVWISGQYAKPIVFGGSAIVVNLDGEVVYY